MKLKYDLIEYLKFHQTIKKTFKNPNFGLL